MRNELKFRKLERRRRHLALLLAVTLHLVVLAAIAYQAEIKDHLPAVLKTYFEEAPAEPPAAEPQA